MISMNHISRKKVIIIGGGGHSRLLIECIKILSDIDIIGILDEDTSRCGSTFIDIPVLGNDELLNELYNKGIQYFVIGVGTTKASLIRKNLYDKCKSVGLKPLSLIHKSAIISDSVHFDEGVQLFPGCIINPGAYIGKNVIINTAAIVEHDCIIGEHSHIATGAKMAGNVQIGCSSHIGIGSTIKENINIGNYVTVGAGSVVISDIADNETVVGVPAQSIKVKS